MKSGVITFSTNENSLSERARIILKAGTLKNTQKAIAKFSGLSEQNYKLGNKQTSEEKRFPNNYNHNGTSTFNKSVPKRKQKKT